MSTSGYLVNGKVDGSYGNMEHKKYNPVQSIRHFCIECQGGHYYEWMCGDGEIEPPRLETKAVKECPSTTCYLHPFRTGRNPRSTKKIHPPG